MVLLNNVFAIAITGENNFSWQSLEQLRHVNFSKWMKYCIQKMHIFYNLIIYHAPVTGSASFPLIINSGNKIEKTQPLKIKYLYIKSFRELLQFLSTN